MKKKIVLAYSGGLDTTVIIPWLKENNSLEKAAEMAAEEYRNNKDLTAFCALDGEDFYETR